MTNDRFQMVGIYHLPKVNMSLETGLCDLEIYNALSELIDNNFCMYHERSMFVWVMDMAFPQVADNPNDNQIKGILAELSRIYFEEECDFVKDFLVHYGSRYDFLPGEAEELDCW